MADLCELNPQRYPFLLESVTGNVVGHRYDILLAFPGERLELRHNSQHEHLSGSAPVDMEQGNFLNALDQWLAQEQHSFTHPNDEIFSNGWFLYLGYELARQIEPRVAAHNIKKNYSLIAAAVRHKVALVHDHQTQQRWIAYETSAADVVETILNDIQLCNKKMEAINELKIEHLHEDSAQQHLNNIAHCKNHIHNGDIFQANLSREWNITLSDSVNPSNLYKRLRKHNPAPFAALAQFADFNIISSSPERLVRVQNGFVDTRPIAGTRPRGSTADADQALIQELLDTPKERAEHIMLIDLERNDLGRISEAGSVEVNELMSVESYAHVHHIVSNIRGRLRKNVSVGDIIRAVFPGGTITGCPKVRCMEILAQLEGCARGPYTGSLGYLNLNGVMDLNILIRTLVQQNNIVRLRAGGGIVADSEPVAELNETRSKAKGLLRALGLNA
ncbi:MAG: aminodeoxychorismate synthase component I [Gammaproteobacteria bacterium]|nr:aminodeoxychorismate synthase component I [Gammaproteobacteria bacterium]